MVTVLTIPLGAALDSAVSTLDAGEDRRDSGEIIARCTSSIGSGQTAPARAHGTVWCRKHVAFENMTY
jgi:hypothetical protein